MSQATEMLAKYLDAEAKLLAGQTVQWGDRRVSFVDLEEIRAGRLEWERKVSTEKRHAAGDHSPVRYSLADFSGGA